MEAILGRVSDGVLVTDAAGTVRLCNEPARRVIGAAEETCIGQHCSHLMHLSVRDKQISRELRKLDCSNGCAILKELAGSAPGAALEVTRDRSGAGAQQLLIGAEAVEGIDGDVVEVVHSIRDITRMKEADDAKTMFLATASHELKTPLTVILGFTQMLLAGWLDPEDANQALQSIETRAQHLGHIVDRLLMTGRIQAGRAHLDVGAVPIAALLKERAESLSAATGRSVVYSVPDDIPPVMADEPALITVLDHLLDNAVKYSPDGGEITLSASATPSTVVITIGDSGIGMDPSEAAQCFERFWQAEQSDVRRFGGTGVGLYIVKSMVDGMDGVIDVQTKPGEGTTFAVTLQRSTEQRVLAAATGVGRPELSNA